MLVEMSREEQAKTVNNKSKMVKNTDMEYFINLTRAKKSGQNPSTKIT